MSIPEDPFMLMSFINMKLRDDDYDTLEALCDSIGCDKEDLLNKLKKAGFEYNEALRQFR